MLGIIPHNAKNKWTQLMHIIKNFIKNFSYAFLMLLIFRKAMQSFNLLYV